MILDRKSTIAGRPVKEVRDGLRRLRDGYWTRKEIIQYYPQQHRDDWLKKPKRFDPTDALLAAELIEPDKEHHGHFRVSDEGIRLSCANLLPPITRAKASALMAAFLQRVAEVQANPDFCFGVAMAYVYGSYITDADILSDIDLCVDLGGKQPWPDVWERWKKRVGYKEMGYPNNPSPEREVQRFLKARCPYLHLDFIPWRIRDQHPNWPCQRIWPLNE